MRSHRRASAARSVLLMLVVAAGFCATSYSQVNTGRILGTVHDPSGAVVANAQVTVRHATTGAKEETVTNANGVYVFPLLPIGEYDLTIAAPGFATLAQKDIRVISSVTTTVDEELKRRQSGGNRECDRSSQHGRHDCIGGGHNQNSGGDQPIALAAESIPTQLGLFCEDIPRRFMDPRSGRRWESGYQCGRYQRRPRRWSGIRG